MFAPPPIFALGATAPPPPRIDASVKEKSRRKRFQRHCALSVTERLGFQHTKDNRTCTTHQIIGYQEIGLTLQGSMLDSPPNKQGGLDFL